MRQRQPPVQAEVHDVGDGMRAADAFVATSWPTAYVVPLGAERRRALLPGAGLRALLLPAGSNAALAEETYRFGFHCITAGPWLADKLEREHGMAGGASTSASTSTSTS